MSNKRDLKKDINHMAYQVLSECFSFLEYSPALNEEEIYNVMHETIALRNDLIYRANHSEKLDSKQIKEHYNKIVADLYEKNIDLIERLNHTRS